MSDAVLLMAYGSPRSPDEVGPYLKDIRGGREPSPEAVASLAQRYARIGGRSPLLDITARQAQALERELGIPVRIGMKHWHPYIAETVAQMTGVTRLVGLALAPHYARMSIGGYEERLRAAAGSIDVRMVRSWYDEPSFVEFWSRRLRETLGDWTEACVIFTAHSLPVSEAEPYVDQLTESAKLVAGGMHHEVAFQSVSNTGVPWLGPELQERLHGERVVVAPIGFVSDHLEILYDIDVEAAEHAKRGGIELRRVPSPNDDPEFIRVLATVVRSALR